MSTTAPSLPDWARELESALENCRVETDVDIVASMSRDQAPFAPAGQASALVRARSIEHVITTLRFANEKKIPVVTRGAGTGLAGGANAVDGCILLSVASMDRILRIDPATRTAVVEPGVLNATLAEQVATQGLFYAPDPASRAISSIGGNIATNAGGSCCLKYGVTGDHVAALKVVTAQGELIKTGAITAKNVAGLDLTRLFVGSEGTLGVIVEATLRLLRAARPASTFVAFFDSLAKAGQAIVALESRLDLSLLEVMDRTTLKAVDDLTRMALDTTAAAFVLAQSDASHAESIIEQCEPICAALGARDCAITHDPDEGKLLLTARRMALPALEKLGATLLDDVAVPRPRLATMIEEIERIAERHSLVIGTFGHAGDGNLHPTIVFDHHDNDSKKRAFAAFDEIVRAAMVLGGTIAGEHGIGTLKQPFMRDMVGQTEQALMRQIKTCFDPNHILNPGKAYLRAQRTTGVKHRQSRRLPLTRDSRGNGKAS
ncbi:MAG: FAD-linked oxidase C-terminal domain-containing protein [Polyangiaceae bacterium]